MFMGVEKTALKQLCQHFFYWVSQENGSIINKFPSINHILFLYKNMIKLVSTVMKWSYWIEFI